MKSSIVLLVAALCLMSCGKRGEPGPAGQSITGPKGDRGETGLPGQDAVLEVIDPCGDAAGIVDEVLIRLADGSVLCSFSANASGQNTRLSILPPGNYQTTDGSGCNFSIDANGNVN